jgi:hypothetical protein
MSSTSRKALNSALFGGGCSLFKYSCEPRSLSWRYGITTPS